MNVTVDVAGNVTSPPAAAGGDDRLTQIKDIMFTIQYFLMPFFLVTGLFGNTMTIITMATRHFRQMTSRYILIFLALSDTVLLLTQPLNKIFIMDLFGRDLRALSTFGCKAFFIIFKSAKMTSSWLVVLLCFERFIAVVFPFKAKFILRKRFILPAIALDYAAMFIYNSVWNFSSQIVGNKCKPDVPSLEHKVFVTIGVTFYSFIPTILLLIFTPMIVIKLFTSNKLRRQLTSSNGSGMTSQTSRKEEETSKASVMVVSVMVAYIVLIIPISSVHIYSWTAQVSAFDMNTTGFFIFREISQILEQVNYAINFFLYVLCSSLFRRRVMQILRCSPDTFTRKPTLTRSASSALAASRQTSNSYVADKSHESQEPKSENGQSRY